ncbi:lipid droplet-regulating VLDL assembly factor AUP1 isoform X1 [Anolis carolinensis]|uniref:lipid droplet-regulating VLDL assembly factor AUP1 isoform X1 n=1 Tax=Anolis carolinensis TaxID=28377 RepID=UPI002F2B359D
MDPAPASAAAAASPSPVGPERLFDSHRLPGDGLLAVALLLYAPVGLCLLLLRLFVGLHVFLVSCALPDSAPRRFVVRAMCAVLGLLVRQSSPRRPPSRLRLLVANHITPFDHNVLSLLLSCGAPVLNGASGFLCWSRGFLEVGPTDSRSELLESLKAYSSQGGNPPLLLFPEETTTNGRVGLLRFSTWPFSISDTVQPVALQVQRPFVSVLLPWRLFTDLSLSTSLPMHPLQIPPKSVADASWVTELLWTFFVPFTVYQVRWLPSVCRQAEETREEFALRVQELLASELGLVSTRLTAADKAEYLKRLRHSPRNSYSSPAPNQPAVARSRAPPIVASAEDVHLMELAQRVKEVLPHVPLAVICKDLAQTNCVDATIANLLEGRVPFTPSEEGEAATAEASLLAPSGSGAHSPPASPPVTPSAAVFARSPEARHLSLQERKRVLYDYARRRFTERHGTMAQREGSR